MSFFHYVTYAPPWVLVLGLIVALTLFATFVPYRWYRKAGKSKAPVWVQAVLTGLAVGFVTVVFSVIIAANSTNSVEQENKTALRTFADDNYKLKLNDQNLELLYWSKNEGQVPVEATDSTDHVQHVYLKASKDGWSLYDVNTKLPLQQIH